MIGDFQSNGNFPSVPRHPPRHPRKRPASEGGPYRRSRETVSPARSPGTNVLRDYQPISRIRSWMSPL
jgi:hypothetical protein